ESLRPATPRSPSDPSVLDKQEIREHRHLWSPLVGQTCIHTTHGVLQTGKGPLPAPIPASPHYPPRGRPAAVLPRLLPLSRRQERNRKADRQRGPACPRLGGGTDGAPITYTQSGCRLCRTCFCLTNEARSCL